jgi:hypothetical protein
MSDASEPALRSFEGDPAHQSMHFITQAEQMLRQVAAVLSSDACDQSLFTHLVSSPFYFATSPSRY